MHGNYHVMFMLQILLELVPFLLQIVVRASMYWLAVLPILLITSVAVVLLGVRSDRGENGLEFFKRSIIVS